MYKKGFIFIPKIHFKKRIFFYFRKGCEKRELEFLYKYDRKVKRNEKIISFILTMIMLLTCTSISVMAADTQSDTTNQDGKMTIGVSVYNLNDAEVRAFRNYFEN